MKFGKIIQAQQVPGWSTYYLDYKFLKKIISSLAANRPASEAAALARGVRPSDILTPSTHAFPRSPSPAQNPAALADNVAPPIIANIGSDEDQSQDFQAHKAAFFFKLERELEKVC
ncbi:SPX-domain-containing protein [Pluteus cervinus]|uniref:SPX-domain-containing protein n=1 Tax=Pluteus cervinus TaxID=181527 RepID=A0ACD3B541_9AGAR|nr:SPX-domain-containing protein [Pluteus cervinus]